MILQTLITVNLSSISLVIRKHKSPNQSKYVNGILKIEIVAVSLKYLSNFWRSLEMLPITRKVELKLKQTKYCILSAVATDNVNGNDNANNIGFTIKVTNLYVPVVTLSARDNQKLSKPLSQGFDRSFYWNEYKTKRENQNTTNKYIYLLESYFVERNRLFLLVYANQDADSKNFKSQRYYLPKGTIDNYNIISCEKTFMINSLILIKNDMKKLEN